MQPSLGLDSQYGKSFGVREGGSVGPIGRQGIEYVDDRHDLCRDWDLIATQSQGISSPVKPFVVKAYRREAVAKGAYGAQHFVTHFDVRLHELPFGFCQRTRLEQDRIRNRDLADIVNDTGA